MIALCKYCNQPISDADMAKTDREKEIFGGGARFLGYTNPSSALFAHESCCKEKENDKSCLN